MKQIGKKLLSATLSALMIVSAFSACGSSPSDAAETSAPASESSSASADSQSTEIPKTGTATGAYVQESNFETRGSPMNLYISATEYDCHTLLKAAEMAGLAGIIGFHEAGDGYLVTFPQRENVQALIDDYKGRLRDLENNIWQH